MYIYKVLVLFYRLNFVATLYLAEFIKFSITIKISGFLETKLKHGPHEK